MTDDKQKQESLFKEAWNNMSNDISRLLPEKMQRGQGKRKIFIIFIILELVVLGTAGKFLYDWLKSFWS